MAEPHHTGTWDGSGVGDLLGWKLVSEEPGLVRAEFQAKEEFRNPKGAIMGGMLAAMLDMIISAAVRSSLKPNQSPRATLEMKVNFIGAAEPGTISAEGKLVHAGGPSPSAKARSRRQTARSSLPAPPRCASTPSKPP